MEYADGACRFFSQRETVSLMNTYPFANVFLRVPLVNTSLSRLVTHWAQSPWITRW